jgi:methylenetetrahydrofolate dehydrogenase (NADP+)/methenyltetrahydrofolate cyclohydrolase/formyltetrahydrofolate synthetase
LEVNTNFFFLKEIGINAKHVHLPASITKEELFKTIDDLNQADNVHGVMVQMPLDSEQKIEPTALLNRILPCKDVDAIGSTNIGRYLYLYFASF